MRAHGPETPESRHTYRHKYIVYARAVSSPVDIVITITAPNAPGGVSQPPNQWRERFEPTGALLQHLTALFYSILFYSEAAVQSVNRSPAACVGVIQRLFTWTDFLYHDSRYGNTGRGGVSQRMGQDL